MTWGGRPHGHTNEAELDRLNKERVTLEATLRPVMRANRAAVKALYDIYRSKFYTERLYDDADSPLQLLWEVLTHPLDRIRDIGTLHVYYLWKESPPIAFEMLTKLLNDYLQRNRFALYLHIKSLEPCARLSVLILAESLVTGQGHDQLPELSRYWRKIIRKLTLGEILMPVVGLIRYRLLSKASNATAEYVNNLREYKRFWDEMPADGAGYSRRTFVEIVRFLDPEEPGFEKLHDLVVEGAAMGDAFNNFLLERVIIAQGVQGYERVENLVDRIFNNDANVCPEYTQVSMLYVVFHTLDKMPDVPEQHFQRFATEYLRPWLDHTGGRFMAHRNKAANAGREYKQYVLNWYGALHSKLYGDGEGDMPLFREYLRRGFEERDRELFLYCIENIAVLASDFGYWQGALRLFEYTLGLFNSQKDLDDFADRELGIGIQTYLARSLATVRGYGGSEVDAFVRDLAFPRFPNFAAFRSELMHHDASESIGDVLTHKLGNVWVYGVVQIPEVRRHIQNVLREAPNKRSVEDWGAELASYAQDALNLHGRGDG